MLYLILRFQLKVYLVFSIYFDCPITVPDGGPFYPFSIAFTDLLSGANVTQTIPMNCKCGIQQSFARYFISLKLGTKGLVPTQHNRERLLSFFPVKQKKA